MSIISGWYQFALQQIAAESYLEHYLRGEELLSDALQRGNTQRGFATGNAYTKLTQSQATDFVSKNQIVAHQANTASGFSATLMKFRNSETGLDEYTLSFRSTEYKNRSQGGDFERDGAGADSEINNSGFAFAQIADMEAYYAQLKRDGVLPTGTKINVTGYSLGGHLATVFTELHATEINKTYIFNGAGRGTLTGNNVAGLVAELNARMAAAGGLLLPGGSVTEGGAQVYGSEWYSRIVRDLTQQFLPSGVGLFSSDPAGGGLSGGADGKIVQIYSHANYDDAEYVANSGTHASAIPVFIEDQPNITGWGGVFGSAGDFGTTHSLILMVDSLALMDTLAAIDPAIDQARMEGLFAIASNQRASGGINANGQSEADSLERIINAMGSLLNATFDPLAPSRTPGDFGDATYRNSFYQALDGLRNRAANLTGTGVVGFIDSSQFQTAGKARGEPIANAQPWSATRIATEALKDGTAGLAYRYALTLLNPFALTGNAAIYATLNAENEFDKVDPTTGKGLTDQWINDRANLLEHVLYYNLRNARYDTSTGAAQPEDSGANRFDSEDIIWEDRAGGLLMQRGTTTASTRYVRFGGDDNDQLTGDNADDRLYGGKGIDVLNGKGGADYLEGGRDFDMLIGGTGNDILLGGEGRDLYYYRTGDGNDRIVDVDGGVLVIHDAKFDLYAAGLFVKKADADEWTRTINDTDGVERTVTLTHTGPWRLVLEGGATLDLGESPDLAKFGIVLSVPSEAAPTEPTIVGDPVIHSTTIAPGGEAANWRVIYTYNHKHETNNEGNSILVSYDVDYFLVDANGNPTEPGGPVRDDTLNGLAGADYIQSKGGNDEVDGQGGKDRIEGGAGADRLHGGDGDDVMLGGTGSADILFGDAGKDTLYAGDVVALAQAYVQGETETAVAVRGEFLDGGADNDILVGSAAEDFMEGGAGADVIYGGAGDDYLSGDGSATEVSLQWAVTRAADNSVINLSGITIENLPLTDHGDDVLYGGKGDDWLIGLGGDDFLDGGSGKDLLVGWEGNDILVGGSGDDELMGDNGTAASGAYTGNDWLDGGDGVDTLYGNGGDDVLIGGKGNDTIRGGAGRDTYIFNKGDEVDTIFDDDSGPEKSILVFGEGFDKDSIKLKKGSLLLDLGDGDAIHIENFDAENPLASQTFASFQFADGSSLGWEELLARGFDLDGTDADDTIIGTGVEDRIDGKAGNDLIWALDGNDVIIGGTGTDGLNGGLGDDTYVFRAGDSSTLITEIDGQVVEQAETLVDEGGANTVQLAAGIDPANLILTDNLDGSLVIDYSAAGQPLDRLLIDGGLDGRIETWKVGAGDTARDLSYTQFIGEFGNGLYRGTDTTGHLHLTGGNTDDSLYSAFGGARVSGGRGNDLLRVYGTANTIHYSVGDGTDQVQTSASANTGNVLKLSGVTADELTLGLGPTRQLMLRVGTDVADAMLFSTFNLANVDATPAFDHIEFAPSTSSGQSGISLSYDALMAKGFDIAGTAEADLLMGTNVDDRIAGGAGDDLLIGGGGDDRYRFNAGDGQDVIQDAEGVNTVEFGAGLTAAGMSVAQSRAEDGQRYLDLDFGNGDRLSVMDGELGRVESFAFADGTTWSTTQLLALLPAVNLRGGDADEVFSGFGGDDLIDGGAGNDVVTGGDGADRLYGGLGNDLLEGDAGADVLDGGAGNDTLAGGSGVDTYRFGAGMGQDTVIEIGGEASVLELMAGTAMVTITARQEGDDLLLATRVGNDALRIAGYYADPNAETNWTVKTADGAVRNMSAFLQGIGEQVSTGSQFIAEFRERFVSGWTAWHVNQGYSFGADGVARRSRAWMETYGASTRFYSETESITLTVESFETGDGEDTYSTNYGFPYRYENSFSRPYLRSDTYQSSVTTTSSAIRQANFSFRGALAQWDQPAGEVPTEPYFIPAQAGALAFGFRLPEGATTMIVKNPDGSLKGTWVYPGASPVQPQPEEQTVTVQNEVIDISTTYTTPISFLGAGDDAVAGLNLDGGSGNDLLAIDSDDRSNFMGMNLPVFLYGNDGNDWLKTAGELEDYDFGEAIMIGGQGRDRLEGRSGRNVYLLLEEDSIDAISDSGNDEYDYWHWYTSTHGVYPESMAGDDFASYEPLYGSVLAADEVVFGPGVTAESLRVLRGSNDASASWLYPDSRFLQLLTSDGIGARIQIAGANDLVGTGIELVSFSDGTRLTVSQLLARVDDSQIVKGSTWNDNLLLGAGDDIIDGGQGNDVLVGAAGNDTYCFGRGSGQDVIDQTDAAANDLDVLRFADDVLPSDVAVFRDDRNLYLELVDSGDLVVLKSWYDGSLHRLSAIEFTDGTVWAGTQFDLSVPFKSISDNFGTSSNDELRGLGDNVDLFGGAGDDTLYAGSGTYLLAGGAGNDLYVFGRGDGAEWIFRDGWDLRDEVQLNLRDVTTVVDQSDSEITDTDYVRMEYGVAPTNVAVARSGNDLVLIIVDTDDRLVLQDWLVAPSNRVRGVQFADGTVWGEAILEEKAPLPKIIGTIAEDVLLGTSAAESIQGLAGNDEIHGFEGADRIEGGAGDDLVSGGQGSDVFLFGRNDGHDVIDQSDAGPGDEDVIRLKAGIDPTDVLLERNAEGLLLTISGTEDSIQVSGAGAGMPISRVEFADGTAWASAVLEAAPLSIVGSEDSDYLEGSEGDDVIRGLGGEDLLAGSYGDDVLIGGAGDDELMGGAGNDVYWFGRGDGHDLIYTDGEDGHAPEHLDVIRFGDNVTPDNVDVIFGPYDLVLSIADTGDSIAIESWQSSWGVGISRIEFGDGTFWNDEALLGMSMEIIGTDDGDDLFGTRRGNLMMGLAGGDYLDGKGGDDTLTGGLGDDWLEGGVGNDVYVISPDDGYDQIFEHSSGPESIPTEISTIRFEQGIAPEDVEIGRGEYGELVFSIQQGYGQVSFNAYPGTAVQVEFSDGTLWGQEIFAATGENLALGTSEFSLMTGSGGNDFLETTSSIYAEIFGLAGDDVLVGDDGDSYLVGGAGNDTLAGGAGEDRYFMDAFSGYDVIAEAPDGGDDWDSIEFGRSITQDQLRFDRYAGDGNDLLVSIVGTTALVIVDDWFASVASSSIEGFYFLNDESEWGSDEIDAAIWANNAAPVFVAENLEAWTGEAFSHSLADAMLTDPDSDRLSYSAMLADGSPLPDWLVFDAATGNLGGTPTNDSVGSLGLRVTATDLAGASAAGIFSITVASSNQAPALVAAIGDQSATQDVAFSWTIPDESFVDSDPGDSLSYTATLADGTALPTWLTFDAATRTFSGTPDAGAPGVLALRVTATDLGGLAAQAEFSLAVGQHLQGTASSDTLNYSASSFVGVAMIDGGLGNDAITGSAGNDIIVGGSGTDNLNGGGGDDLFLLSGTDAGYDRFEGGAGYDVLQGSTGDDTFRMYNFSGTATVERIDGNGGNDVIAGTGSSDTLIFSGTELVGIAMIDGGVGNDAITGSVGNDIIVGGSGTDNLIGGDGDDTFLLSGIDAGYDRFDGGAGYDVLQGSAGDDTFRMYNYSGTATVEKIDGGGGNDVIAGTGSSDTLNFSGTELVGIAMIDGGAGNDAITGSVGNDIIVGGSGTDNLIGGDGDDTFLLSGTDLGYDRFKGGAGFDVLQGSTGDDTFRMYNFSLAATVERIDGNGGSDVIAGTGSSDTLNFSGTELVGIAMIDGGAGNDAITGSVGNDIIVGGSGTDNLSGGDGDDTFMLSGTDAGYDRFEGGAGFDVLQGSTGDDTFRMYNFSLAATVEKIDGNGGNDIIAGTGSSDTLDFSGTELVGIALIDGGLGNDAITGSVGDDIIVGGSGTDNLSGGDGDDTFLLSGIDAGYDRFDGGAGYDVLQGSAGDDTIRMYNFSGTATVERIDSGGGDDIVAGTGSSDTLDFSGTELVGIAMIDGGAGNDAIIGSSGNDIIVGGSGTDNLSGGDGDDTFLVSGTDAGYDRFEGGLGFDLIQGSTGDDTIRMYNFSGTATVERIDGNGGNDIIAGTGSSDTLDFSGTELVGIAMIDGGAGNDAITGSAGNDIIVGGSGTDNLSGGDGDDTFLLSGTDAGYDRFEGGAGYDVLQGSTGDDTFRMYNFSGTATVERIDGNGGNDIIAGTGSSDPLDFSNTELVGIAMIDGGAGNDAITGSVGNDLIVGGTGTDRLTGGQGSDTYRIGLGDGADTVVEDDITAGNTDVAEFLAGISADQIWLRHLGNNLEASIIGTADKLTVQNWYLGGQHHVEQFRTADGKLLLDSQVENLVQAMAAFAPPGAGQTTLPPIYQDSLAPVIAANWQ